MIFCKVYAAAVHTMRSVILPRPTFIYQWLLAGCNDSRMALLYHPHHDYLYRDTSMALLRPPHIYNDLALIYS